MQETVTREDGRSRQQLGGVGGIMARELGRAGANVTLMAPVIEAQRAEMAELVREHSITPQLAGGMAPHTRRAEARILVKQGEPVSTRGYFAKPPPMWEAIREVRADYDWVLAALYIDPTDPSLLAGAGGNVVANATTRGMAQRLGRMRGIAGATMNQQEHLALCQALRHDPEDNPAQRLGIAPVFVTRGPGGRTDYWMNGNRRDLPAVETPAGTDFIGAGDSMTGGYAYAVANQLPTDRTMDEFLLRLLQYNAASYK